VLGFQFFLYSKSGHVLFFDPLFSHPNSNKWQSGPKQLQAVEWEFDVILAAKHPIPAAIR